MLWLTRKSPLQHVSITRTRPSIRLLQPNDRCRTPTQASTSPFITLCNSMTTNHQACSSEVVQGEAYTDKVVGSFLAALCADALGAAAEGWTAHRIQQTFPDGLSSFQKCRMGLGTYTDDGQMLLALAAGLVNQGGVCKDWVFATEYAKAFDPNRGYGGSAEKILSKLQQQLQQGPLPATTGTELLAQGGSYGNGGAMRVAPLGFAYRNAPVDVVKTALVQTLIPTHHLHPWAIEGALAQALAVADLSRLQPPTQALGSFQQQNAAIGTRALRSSVRQGQACNSNSNSSSSNAGQPVTIPADALEFLRVLQQQMQNHSDVMCARLKAMEQGLDKLYATPGGPKLQQQSWQQYITSPAWMEELSTAAAVAPGEPGSGFQIKGTDAVAAAIWACVAHWEGPPVDAIIAAVHYGGDTDTIACMAGALIGARYGSSWLPKDWLKQLEQDAPGTAFFNMPAVEARLSPKTPKSDERQTEAGADGAQNVQEQQQQGRDGVAGAGGVLVHTTRNMGRQGATVLAQLVAQLDCRDM